MKYIVSILALACSVNVMADAGIYGAGSLPCKLAFETKISADNTREWMLGALTVISQYLDIDELYDRLNTDKIYEHLKIHCTLSPTSTPAAGLRYYVNHRYGRRSEVCHPRLGFFDSKRLN